MLKISKNFTCSLLGVGILAVSGSVHSESAVLTGGWVADFSPAMMETEKTSTTVFQFEGSYKMSTKSKGDVYLLLTCIGMEAATKVKEDETITKGSGRCELKDKSGEKLLAAMDTAFDGFKLTIDGGTGKWALARGSLVSKENFTVETDRQLKGYSNIKGEINFAK
jgi:hypothetical protein